MAGRPPQHSREEIAKAALAIIDESGFDALTFRSLGARLDIHPTAIYRYFPNRDALLTTVMDLLFGEVIAEPEPVALPARDRLLALMLRARTVFMAHPNIALLVLSSNGISANGAELMRRALAALEELGFSGDELIERYQAIESFVLGATAFDLLSAPGNIEMRRARYSATEHPAFMAVANAANGVAVMNERAFRFACDALVDSLLLR